MNPTKAKPGAGWRRASQGANAWTAASNPKCNALVIVALILARCDMDTASQRLQGIALELDGDDPGLAALVAAADLLDAAIVALAGPP